MNYDRDSMRKPIHSALEASHYVHPRLYALGRLLVPASFLMARQLFANCLGGGEGEEGGKRGGGGGGSADFGFNYRKAG